MKKVWISVYLVLMMVIGMVGTAFGSTVVSPIFNVTQKIDNATHSFLFGKWRVDKFLGFPSIYKDGIPDGGQDIIGNIITINDNIFSSVSFSPKYDWFAREIENPQYFVEDIYGSPMTGEAFCTTYYKINPNTLNINPNDKVQIIDAISPDKTNSSVSLGLITINNSRLLLCMDSAFFELKKIPSPVYRLNWEWNENVDPPVNDNFKITFDNDVVVHPTSLYRFFMCDGQLEPLNMIIIENDRALMPVEAVAENLCVDVVSDIEGNKVSFKKGNTEIILTLDSTKATVNGVEVSLDTPAKVVNGVIYIPLRFVSQNLGAEVGYYKQYPYYNYPLIWIENEPAQKEPNGNEDVLISKEKAVESVKQILQTHLDKFEKENPFGYTPETLLAQKEVYKKTFNKLNCVGEFARFWVFGNGYDDSSSYSGLLIDKYTGEVYYYRGVESSYWIGTLDYDGFYSMYFAG